MYEADAVPTVYNIDDIPEQERGPGTVGQYFRGHDTIIGFNTLDEKTVHSEHSHPWEQIAFVVEGTCDFVIDGKEVTLDAGDIVNIPPGVKHSSATDETALLMAIFPLREDYLPFTEYQHEYPPESA
ncbi:cupin domain-containing protein [Salinigranum rubrum]|nr:cupin domain-containing protein [Salinigranum rubrum]